MTVLRSVIAVVLVPCVLLGILAACGSVPRTQRDISALYNPSDLNLAASRGTVPVVVFDGAGGGLASDPLQQAAVAALQSGTTTDADFTAVPQAPSAGYKVVMLFNGPWVTGDALCRTTTAPTARSAETMASMHLMAAFCSDQRMLTEVEGFTDGVESADDPQLRSLLRQAAFDLFPARDAGIHDVRPE